jgi:hypothetical protein
MPKVFKTSPELGDGQHWSIAETKEQLLKTINLWCDEEGGEVGEYFSVSVIEMTREEIDALPEM